ncbi:MAG: hypothetical protein GXP25_12355 [Planctomycetes bacterium]|nr:hypothetical protein [Planctomycetota bacterium]
MSTRLENHVVICGWNDAAMEIVRQIRGEAVRDRWEIVVVADDIPKKERDLLKGWDTRHIQSDPADKDALREAGICSAARAIILADRSAGTAADAKSILIALAIEALNEKVHTAVEIIESPNRSHFERTRIDEIVCVGEIAEKLLAQAALTHGLTEFYTHLLTTTSDTNEIYVVDICDALVGKTFAETEEALADHDFIPIGIRSNGVTTINPRLAANAREEYNYSDAGARDRDTYKLKKDDQLLVIAYSKPEICL